MGGLVPKVLVLTGSLSNKTSSGMGTATVAILNHLAEIVPLELIKSSDETFHAIKNCHTLNPSSTRSTLNTITFRRPISTHELDFLISPYLSNEIQVIQRNHTIDEVVEKTEDNVSQLTELENVALYNDSIVELAQTMSFDIIYAHDWITFQAAIQLKLKTGKKLVVHVHSLEIDRNFSNQNPIIYNLERKAMDYADAVVTVSNYTKERIRKYYDIYSGKIEVVYNAVEKTVIDKKPRENKNLTVLFMGRLTPQKGVFEFIKIAELVLKENPSIQFVIAGEGELGEEIETILLNSLYEDNFTMCGYLNQFEKNDLFALTDVLCMPSISEPFGLVAIEAAEAGIACVISEDSGCAEILVDSLKVDITDLVSFKDAILQLVNDSSRKEVVRLQQKNLSNLTWKDSVMRIKKIFSDL